VLKNKQEKLPEILSAEEIKLMIDSAPKPYDLAIRCIFNIGAGFKSIRSNKVILESY